MVAKAKAREMKELRFPKVDYYLDESEPDVAILHRQEDDSLVAAFSARGATRESIVEAAKEDYRELIRALLTRLAGRAKTFELLTPKTPLIHRSA